CLNASTSADCSCTASDVFCLDASSLLTASSCARASARWSSSAGLSPESPRAGAPPAEGGIATGLGVSAAYFSCDTGCAASRDPGRRIQTATTSTTVATGTSQRQLPKIRSNDHASDGSAGVSVASTAASSARCSMHVVQLATWASSAACSPGDR